MAQFISVARTFRSQSLRAVCAIGILSALACPAGDSAVRQSQDLLSQTMQSEPAYATYGMSLLARSETPFATQQIVDSIRSETAQTARAAVSAIIDAPPPGTREALQEVFATKGGLLKLNAASALVSLGDAEALEFIGQESMSGGGTLTGPIARILAEGDHADQLKKILAKRMENKEQSIRDEAYGVLGEVGQPWATSMLVTGLGQQRGESRQQAIISLGRTGDPGVASQLHKFTNTKGLVFATLEALGALGNPDSLKIVKKATTHEEPLVRAYAAAAAWRLGDEETGKSILSELASDEDERVRLNVAQQLRLVGQPGATDLLRGFLSDDAADVRLEAIRGLAANADPGLESVFVGALADKSYEVSTSALDALAKVGGESSLEAIQGLLENRNPYVVMSAANAVLEIKHRLAPSSS